MFDQILNLVKESLGSSPAAAGIPPGQEAAVHQEVAGGILDEVKAMVSSGGGLCALTSLFSGNSTASPPVAGNAVDNVISRLVTKLGLPPETAASIASMVPGLIQQFQNKVKDPADNGFDIQGILNHFKGH